MSRWRNDILELTSSNNPTSFFQWNKLLNFYNENKEELDEKEYGMVLDKSEEYRLYLNSHCGSGIERHEVKI